MELTNKEDLFGGLINLEREIAKMAATIEDPDKRRGILVNAAYTLRDKIREKVPVSNKVVKRYSNGKVVATYYPGNLKRSIQIFDHMRDKSSVYLGVLKNPSGQTKGEFRGSRVDGWYAHFVEYGQRKKPYFRPTVDIDGPKVLNDVVRDIAKIIDARS
jgi:hypothetical protein